MDIEAIGGRWLQHAGLIVLVLGVAFFLRYAFDRQWLSPAVRLALGGIAGVAMAVGGLRLSQTYRAYGLLTSGAGAAVLYLSVYAGLNLYFLFGPTLAFTLLVVITAAVAWVADRTGSMALGFMAVCGGFATPFLVGGGTDQQLTLFSYVATAGRGDDVPRAPAELAVAECGEPGVHRDHGAGVGRRVLHAQQVPSYRAVPDGLLRHVCRDAAADLAGQ